MQKSQSKQKLIVGKNCY